MIDKEHDVEKWTKSMSSFKEKLLYKDMNRKDRKFAKYNKIRQLEALEIALPLVKGVLEECGIPNSKLEITKDKVWLEQDFFTFIEIDKSRGILFHAFTYDRDDEKTDRDLWLEELSAAPKDWREEPDSEIIYEKPKHNGKIEYSVVSNKLWPNDLVRSFDIDTILPALKKYIKSEYEEGRGNAELSKVETKISE